MNRVKRWGIPTLLAWLVIATPARADEFERLEATLLNDLIAGKGSSAADFLTVDQLGNLPRVLRDTRSALVLASSDQGNPARLLVEPGFRKGPKGELVPILVLERFDTFEGGPATSRLARGRGVILFDGFRFDLDTGQVVPDAQGGDIQFLTTGDEGPRLAALGSSKLFTVKSLPPETAAPGKPTAGRTVQPGDFAGRFRLFADGRWSGRLDLSVDEDGLISGKFRSDQTGSTYAVTGLAAADAPEAVRFAVELPRARLQFEGRLWTDGKGALAGSGTMLDKTFGFFAIREGGRVAPLGEDVEPINRDEVRPQGLVIAIRPDGKLQSGNETIEAVNLVATIRKAVETEPKTWVLLRVPEEMPYSKVRAILDTIQDAGIKNIRLVPAEQTRDRAD